jgi:hypothetical protein
VAAFTASSTVTSFDFIFLPSSTAVKDIKSIFLLLAVIRRLSLVP